MDVKSPAEVLPLNAIKAFSWLEWTYLWTLLQAMGFIEGFIDTLKMSHYSPSAVLTVKDIPPLLPFARSSRPGCPLTHPPHTPRVLLHFHLNPEYYLMLYVEDVFILHYLYEEFGAVRFNWCKSVL